MSDEEHHFESTDVGASKTYPQQAGIIRKNDYIVIRQRACKVVEVSTSKTQHGHVKCHFVAIDIFNGRKLEDIVPSSQNCDVPHVNRTDYQLIDISENGSVSVLTKNGNTKDDLKLPTDDTLFTQMTDGFADGKNLVVTVLSAMGEEHICAIKDIGPKLRSRREEKAEELTEEQKFEEQKFEEAFLFDKEGEDSSNYYKDVEAEDWAWYCGEEMRHLESVLKNSKVERANSESKAESNRNAGAVWEPEVVEEELGFEISQVETGTSSLRKKSDRVAQLREEVNNLRHANEDLAKQVEERQMNRFSEVEELVYLGWANACLRYERNYQTPAGKPSARDLSKNLSPKSQERAKQLMLEYAGSERGQGETDFESIFSQPSSPGSEDFDSISMGSSTSKMSNFSKKAGIIQKLKKWGKCKDDSSTLSSPARSLGGNSPSRRGMSYRSSISRGPLELLMLRNASDSMAITTFGKEQDPPESPETPNLPRLKTRVASSDSLNTVASSFQLMSKSVEGVMDKNYPAYEDRHKLALERVKALEGKAKQARAERFGDSTNLGTTPESRTRLERERPTMLPPKLAHLKEKITVSGDLTDNNNKDDVEAVSKMKLAEIERQAPRVPSPPPKPSSDTPGTTTTTTLTRMPPAPPLPPMPPGALPPPLLPEEA